MFLLLFCAACFQRPCEGQTEPGRILGPCPVPVIEPARATAVDAGDVTRDAGPVSDGGADAGPPPSPSSSTIAVSQRRLRGVSTEQWSTQFHARFVTQPIPSWESQGCERLVLGSCQNVRCLGATLDEGFLPVEPAQSAGTLSLSGLGRFVSTEPRLGGTGGPTYSEYAVGQTWRGGESVTAAASGSAQVTAFTTPTLTAPSIISLTSPSCPNQRCGSITRANPLLLTLDGPEPAPRRLGTVRVSIIAMEDFDFSFTECLFPATSTSVTIPPEAMRLLVRSGPTPVPTETALQVENISTTTFDVEGREVSFTLSHEIGGGTADVR